MRPLSFLILATAAAVLASTPAAAGSLGCSGAHAVASGFRPCTDADSYRKARLEHESGHHMGH